MVSLALLYYSEYVFYSDYVYQASGRTTSTNNGSRICETAHDGTVKTVHSTEDENM